MKKETFDRLKELVETASLLNPNLIDEEAFKKEVCEILDIKTNSTPILYDESKYLEWMERMKEVKLPDYKPLEIYYSSKTNGVDGMEYVTTRWDE
jgi:hypothetical protein